MQRQHLVLVVSSPRIRGRKKYPFEILIQTNINFMVISPLQDGRKTGDKLTLCYRYYSKLRISFLPVIP